MTEIHSPVRTMDAAYYTDPEIYRHEQERGLARTWQFAGHVSQVKEAGDYFSFDIAGQSLFCIRGKDDGIRVFYNVCQHRAHEMVSGAGNKRTLACPYHAWTYEMDGRLKGGLNIKSVPGLNAGKICLTSVRSEIFFGFIFVNLDPHAKPMDDWFPGVRDELAAFVPQIQQLQPLEWVKVPEQCNWKISVENYSECYHCGFNHPTFASGVINPKIYDIRPQGHCLRHTTECQNLDQMTYDIDLQANEKAGQYSSWYLWPMFSFQVYPGNVLNTYHWRPSGVGEVDVWRGWYSIDGEESDVVRKLAIQDRETTVEEDIHLVESVHRGLHSRGFQPGPLVIDPNYGVNSEHSLQVLQDWMRDGADTV